MKKLSGELRNAADVIYAPDGRSVYFVTDRGESIQQITVSANGEPIGEPSKILDASGSRIRQISLSANGKHFVYSALSTSSDICPTGNRSAFCSLTIEGRKQEKLFDFDDYTHVTRLSPDGKQVAFNLTRGETTNIWVASIEGGAPRQLTFDRELAGFPVWSPDGKWIAFEEKRGAGDQVCIIPIGGGEVIQLTNDKGQSWAYAWSPDGDKVIYAGERHGIWNVYWVSLSTREQKQLTNFTQMNTYVRYPACSPAGDQIVYEYAKTTGNIWMVDLKLDGEVFHAQTTCFQFGQQDGINHQ